MRKRLPKILVTGGAGFIGSAFARQAVRKGYGVVIVDKLTYAGDLKRLNVIKGCFKFYKADICDKLQIDRIFSKERPRAVVNFAAETHVDRSIKDAAPFLETNINGTKVLLDSVRRYDTEKFLHISTDEVYGDIEKGQFFEDFPLKPNSPYSAAKAGADLLINSYMRTYSLPAMIARPCNNYGPWQYPEKFVPLSVLKILRGEKIPVYGTGKNVREWLYVEECAQGLFAILNKGRVGSVYNLGSGQESRNLETVKLILGNFNLSKDSIQFVKDRLGHDLRYSLNSRKLFKDTGWKAGIKLEDGLKLTISWCLKNKPWLLSKWKHIAALYK